MSFKKINLKTLTLILSCLLAFSFSASSATNTDKNHTLVPLALQGYDAISYFKSDKVQKGSNAYQTVYDGKRYSFVNQTNQQMFTAHPEQFLPQFNGYCAHSATLKSPVDGDPSIYSVEQGKLFLFSSLEAKNSWVNKVDKDNVGLISLALQGYDVTTYFDNSAAIKGKDAYQAVYKDKRYLFVSQENLQKFAASPEQFLPQFGGYCAHSVSLETPMQSNPAIYTVEEGNLFLFNSNEAKDAWAKQPTEMIGNARKYWTYEATKRNKEIEAKGLWKTENKVKLFTF